MIKAGLGKVVLLLDNEEEYRDGLFIPETNRDKVQKGTVVGVANDSPDYMVEGLIAFIPEVAGINITHEGVTYKAVKLHEVYCYLEK